MITPCSFSIGEFENSNIETFNIPEIIETPADMFRRSLVKKVTMDYGTRIIGPGTFQFCEELEQIQLTDTIRCICDESFEGCEKLTHIEFPEELEKIGAHAFYGSGLQTVTIPDTLYFYGSGAFGGCKQLQAINVETDHPNFISKDGVLFSADSKKLIQFPAGKHDMEYQIPDGVEEIASEAFAGARVETLVFPKTLKKIGYQAFYGCFNLKHVKDRPADLRIDPDAFEEGVLVDGIH